MDKVNIGESTLKDFGNVINEAADILNKGKVAFDNSIPDKTLQVLPYTGQAGALIPSKIGDLNDLTTTNKDNIVSAINEVNNNLSSNTNVVTLDTDQTITGDKTFDGDIVTNRGINLGDGGNLSTDGDYIRLTSERLLDRHKNIGISSSGSLELTGLNGVLKLESHSLDGFVANVYGGGNLSMTTYSNGDIDMLAYDEGTININGNGGLTLRSSKDLDIVIGDTGTLYMTPHSISEFQRVLEMPSLTEYNGWEGLQEFRGNVEVEIGATFSAYDVTFYNNIEMLGPCKFKCSAINPGLDIIPSEIGRDEITINLSDNCTLTMNARMISELKRLLGIS